MYSISWFYASEMNWIVKGVKAKTKTIENICVTWNKINKVKWQNIQTNKQKNVFYFN